MTRQLIYALVVLIPVIPSVIGHKVDAQPPISSSATDIQRQQEATYRPYLRRTPIRRHLFARRREHEVVYYPTPIRTFLFGKRFIPASEGNAQRNDAAYQWTSWLSGVMQ